MGQLNSTNHSNVYFRIKWCLHKCPTKLIYFFLFLIFCWQLSIYSCILRVLIHNLHSSCNGCWCRPLKAWRAWWAQWTRSGETSRTRASSPPCITWYRLLAAQQIPTRWIYTIITLIPSIILLATTWGDFSLGGMLFFTLSKLTRGNQTCLF